MTPKSKNEEATKLTIKKFDLSTLLPDAVTVIIGRRRSGKSWLVREIMHTLAKRGVPYGKVYSGTEHCSPFFGNFFPSLFIHSEFTDADLEQLMENQRLKVRKYAKRHGIEDGRCNENNMLLVFDDMLGQDDIWKKSQSFKRIFTEGRHYGITFYLILQTVLGIPPSLRENIDYAFLFSNDGNNLKRLWENYAGVIESFDMFKQIFYSCTRDKGCLVINKTSSSDDITDKVFFYKAKDPGPFKFGSRAFWKLHEDRYRDSDDEESHSQKLARVIETYGVDGKKYTISME